MPVREPWFKERTARTGRLSPQYSREEARHRIETRRRLAFFVLGPTMTREVKGGK
ncbi:MAG: hypothetical protein ACQEQT_10925 [Chloroflexota bacterium]